MSPCGKSLHAADVLQSSAGPPAEPFPSPRDGAACQPSQQHQPERVVGVLGQCQQDDQMHVQT